MSSSPATGGTRAGRLWGSASAAIAFSSSCVLSMREMRKTSSDEASLKPRVPIAISCGVMAGAEVVCADGIDGVEAVVVRHAPSGTIVSGERVRVHVVHASSKRPPRSRHPNRPSPEWERWQ